MSSSITSLLDISRRALAIQSQSIRVIGNNISNVNNPDYARRVVDIVSDARGGAIGIQFGSGATMIGARSVVDNFLNREYQRCLSDTGYYSIQSGFLKRAESLFSLDAVNGRIGMELSKFFSALEDLQADPSSISYRLGVVSQGDKLCQSINYTYDNLAILQREADDRMAYMVVDINRITEGIATLNDKISRFEVAGREALSLRDQRDGLLKELSKYISFQTMPQGNNMLNITLSDGAPLVVGSRSYQLEYTASPSFVTGMDIPPGLDGGPLGFITYNCNPIGVPPAHIDLTGIIAGGSGELSGLLNLRGVATVGDTSAFDVKGTLVDAASYIELIARDLLVRFNTSYLAAVDNGFGVYEPTSGDLLGNPSNTFVAGIPQNTFALFAFKDANSATGGADMDLDGLPSWQDLVDFGLPSYASLISFNVRSPSGLATALDLSTVPGTYEFAPGDGRNIQDLLDQRNAQINYSLGRVTAYATIGKLYDSAVSYVGIMKREMADFAELAVAKETQVYQAVSEVSGVDLDEEFSKLILFQRAYEAAARMIKVGDDLLGEVIGLLK